MKVNTKLNIIIFLFIVMFIIGAFVLLEAQSLVSVANVQIQRVHDIGTQMGWFQNNCSGVM